MISKKMFKEMHFVMTTIELVLDDYCLDYELEIYKEKPLIKINCLNMPDGAYNKVFNELEQICSYYDSSHDNVEFMGCYMFKFDTFNLLLHC